MAAKIKCIVCGRKLTGQQEKYCSKVCADKNKDKGKAKISRKLRAHKRRLELIMLKGAECEICGYNKNLAALHFHHIDPSLKVFALEGRNIKKYSMKRLLAEAAKCQLLCSNCHMETHFPDLNDMV